MQPHAGRTRLFSKAGDRDSKPEPGVTPKGSPAKGPKHLIIAGMAIGDGWAKVSRETRTNSGVKLG
jgi:hypothetical protein